MTKRRFPDSPAICKYLGGNEITAAAWGTMAIAPGHSLRSGFDTSASSETAEQERGVVYHKRNRQESLYVDADARGVDHIPDFLSRGIDDFCKPHGKSMQISAGVRVDVNSGRWLQHACFVCEDGWVVFILGVVGENDVHGLEFSVHEGKIREAKGSFRVCVSSGTEMSIERRANEKMVFGILNNPGTKTIELNVVGEPFSSVYSQELMYSDVEMFLAELMLRVKNPK